MVLPALMQLARRVITVSEFSRARLLEWSKLPPDRIVAIPNGVGEQFLNMGCSSAHCGAERFGIERPFVLTVGTLEPRKNLARLFEAWEILGLGEVDLVVVGSSEPAFRSSGFESIPKNVRLLGRVSDAELPRLIAAAELFVYPSLYEGFGLPPLEAMACGVPVVASNAEALVEVLGSAACYVDPLSPAAIAKGLEDLLSDTELRRELRERGLKHARCFTWDRCARRTAEVLSATAESRN
jgi:glycosyltransferase involved in cell wall biosynthesis